MTAPKSESTLRSRFEERVKIDTGAGLIEGNLAIPEKARGAVIFAHGNGSSRRSPRNRFVAQALHDVGLATLLVDLLTAREAQVGVVTAEHRFDIQLLAERLTSVTDWLDVNFAKHEFRYGFFGASTGVAAALVAAARRPTVAAVVSRGGRPDLVAADVLRKVRAAVLLIIGGNDVPVIGLNRAAYQQLAFARQRELKIIPGATHLFEEQGALEEVARLAGRWFEHYLYRSRAPAPSYMESRHGTSQTTTN